MNTLIMAKKLTNPFLGKSDESLLDSFHEIMKQKPAKGLLNLNRAGFGQCQKCLSIGRGALTIKYDHPLFLCHSFECSRVGYE